jgi:hypothetical protein
MSRTSSLTDARLDLLYNSTGFGGETTMRAKVIRELIDEIRALRRELQDVAAGDSQRGDHPRARGPEESATR